jgi:hypothetical protein
MTPTVYIIYDRRTGKRCQKSSYMTRAQAEEAIRGYRRRDERGGRPDIHDLIPHLGVAESTPETFGSSPGDVVAEPDR